MRKIINIHGKTSSESNKTLKADNIDVEEKSPYDTKRKNAK